MDRRRRRDYDRVMIAEQHQASSPGGLARPSRRRLCAALLAVATGLTGCVTASAEEQAEQLIFKSRWTLEDLLENPNLEQELPLYLKEASGVLIFPDVFKGGFILGGEGGTGVLLAKDETGAWGQPAFFTLASGSVGLQIGGQLSQVVLTVMNEEAVRGLLNEKFKLGADASVAVGVIGGGIETSTTSNFGLDVYAFSTAVGLFGGGALEGALIVPRDSLNQEFYGQEVTPSDIILHGKVANPKADDLRRALPR